jgi:probable HAF family extracellular repeat protein
MMCLGRLTRLWWVAFLLVLALVALGPAWAQDAVTTLQLPDGSTTQLTFTTIDVPGAGFTTAMGINAAGQVVGNYGATINGRYHGFLLNGGNFTFFDYPDAYSTLVGKINDSGVIVGNTSSLTGRELGFSYDGSTFTAIRAGKMAVTDCIGVNDAGAIVGGMGQSDTRAFELRGSRFKTINFPGLYFFALWHRHQQV